MSKGLAIARNFYEAGHNVIGADFEPDGALACGRFSKSISKFYPLRAPDQIHGSGPYIGSLLDIVRKEKVDIWVSCSGVASAVEDGEAMEILQSRSSCRAIQFNTKTTQMLHEKHSFMKHTREIGLTVPDTHYITSHQEVEDALRNAPDGRKYIMKPVGMDDANRGDMTLLPKEHAEDTVKHVSRLQISEKSSWILQQYISGPEYCTHSLVINGQVKAFAACPSAEMLMHYEALPAHSKLHQAMFAFTKAYAEHEGEGFTGHLSFDFMVDRGQLDGQDRCREGQDPIVYPIECNPRAHTAVVLFNGTPGMADAYLSLLSSTKGDEALLRPLHGDKYYWIGHDLMELMLLPVISILLCQPDASIVELGNKLRRLLNHVVYWRDGTFERWDPLPWWWLYHGYWPRRIWQSFREGKKWSRINVSTTKVFEC